MIKQHEFEVVIQHKLEKGQDLTEYGLLVGFVAFIVLAGARIFGQSLLAYFTWLASSINW